MLTEFYPKLFYFCLFSTEIHILMLYALICDTVAPCELRGGLTMMFDMGHRRLA